MKSFTYLEGTPYPLQHFIVLNGYAHNKKYLIFLCYLCQKYLFMLDKHIYSPHSWGKFGLSIIMPPQIRRKILNRSTWIFLSLVDKRDREAKIF
jgi:hypothetical protein